MSNNRNSAKAAIQLFALRVEAPASVIHWPTTSSITTIWGSLLPVSFAMRPAAQMAGAISSTPKSAIHGRKHLNMRARPRRGPVRPAIPRFRVLWGRIPDKRTCPEAREGAHSESSSCIWNFFERLRIYRRRDRVFLRRPVAQIDDPAAVATEGNEFAVRWDHFTADRTPHSPI